MSDTKPVKVRSLQDLQLFVHVIGYYPEGECILIIMYDAEKKEVSRSILIDCYIDKNKENPLCKLISGYDISLDKPLDLIIWTHPDRDHSQGLEEVLKRYVNKKTLIVLPEGANAFTIIRKGVKLAYQMLLAMLNKEVSVEHVNTSNHRRNPEEYLYTRYVDGAMDQIEMSIEILTPNGTQVIRKTDKNKTHENNDISISLIIHCGKLDLYFGGDVEVK